MKKRFLLLVFSLLFLETEAQSNQQIDTDYKNALKLYQEKKTFEAIAEFEKIIKLDPNHKDALYNLAIINYQLGDNVTAIRLLKRGIRLNDKRPLKVLRDQLHQKISYADTMQNIDVTTSEKFAKIKDLSILTLNDLTEKILSVSSNKKEQLQMLLLWSYHNMHPDTFRFFNGGNPLSIEESFLKRKGLCDEFSNIVSAFCKKVNIPSFKVPGYVKYPNYNPGDPFRESNHAWNAVYLDTGWVLCDLFWSITALEVVGSMQPHFIKHLNTDYFLGHPIAFINDHLPSDPVFQFQEYPIEIKSFTNSIHGIDSTVQRMAYLNYQDSLRVLLKMKADDQSLRIANRSYVYNKNNPDELITENFNYAVNILNKKTSTKSELLKAKACFTLALSIIDSSKNDEVRALKENCKTGLTWINKRITGSP